MRRHIFLYIIALLAGLWMTSCSEDNVYDSLPEPISQFIAQYYPGTDVTNFSNSGGIYTVKVSGGPTITFNKDYNWLSIDANGNTVPEVFLYDRLPAPLYEYLQSTQATHSVYAVNHDSRQYTIKLLDSNLTYDIATSQITGSGRP